MTTDERDSAEAKTSTNTRQNDKLYTAEGILDPRKRRAEKKRRKANRQNLLNQMDADYDFKLDYQMKDAPSDDNSDDGDDGDNGEATEEAPMAGVEMDA